MVRMRKRAGRAAAYAVVLTLLFTACGGLAACGVKEPVSDGLVPMGTAKTYEHVAKTEIEEPTPTPEDGGGQTDPGEPGNDVGTGTVTPPVTATPEPDGGNQNEDIVYVAVSKLNLRAEPSLESEVVAQAKYGESFVRTEKGTQGWDKLLYNGQEVYAYAEYLSDQKVSGVPNSISGQAVADAKKK